MKMSRLAFALLAASLPLIAGCGGGGGGSASSRLSAVTGRVVNERDQPVSGASVSLMPASTSRAEVVATTVTNGSGSFSLTNVQAGTYTLSVRAAGPGGVAIEVQVSVTVPEGSDVDIQIRIIQDGSSSGVGVIDPAESVGAVIGKVFNSLGQPAAGVSVTVTNTVTGENFTTTTNAQGEFVIDNLREGAWTIYAHTPGLESVPFLINIVQDTVIQTDIFLPGATLPPGSDPGTGGSGSVSFPGNGNHHGHLIGVGHTHHGNGNGNGHDNHDHD